MIHSVERAIDILQIVASNRDWIGVREIARQAELNPATTQQLLKTLLAKGLLEFDASRRQYRLGIGAMLLAAAVDPMQKLLELVSPFVVEVAETFGETVVAMTYEGGHFVVVKSQASRHELTVKPPADFQSIPNPADMASSRMLLALLPPAERTKYVADALVIEDLDRSLADGYCKTENINNSGITAIAVPVCSKSRRVMLALACSAPSQRFPENRQSEVLDKLFRSARAMESIFAGFSGEVPDAAS